MVRFDCNHINQMRFTVKNLKVFTVLFLILNINITMSANTKVYIIHGHGGNRLLMNKITKHVQNEGYPVENFGYPSFTEDIVSVSERLYNKINAENYDTISFVTHSMGALIVRNLYKRIQKTNGFPTIHRIVMIAPPNNGTPVADYFYPSKFWRFILGKNAIHLTTGDNSGANALPIPDCETGLIFGIKGSKNGYNPFLKADNDGYIVPEHAMLGIEKEIEYIKAGHTSITQKSETIKLVINFLEKGMF
jgi:hypothetical protein